MPNTAVPIKTGEILESGRPTLHPSVRKNIKNMSKNAPRPSATNALKCVTEITAWSIDGLGKYSPNIIAVRTDSEEPRIMLLANSNLIMEPEKIK